MQTQLEDEKGQIFSFDELLAKISARLEKPKAELEQAGMLAGITGLEVAGVPLGAAAVGGGAAVLVSGLMDRFLPQVTGMTGKLLAAWAVVQFGSRFLGKDAAKYAALFLAWDAVAEPVERIISQITGGLGLAQGLQQEQPQRENLGRSETLDSWLARA